MEVREVEVQAIPKVILEWPNKTSLIQLVTTMEYVILDDNYQTTHKPFYCKDYFNEIIATELDGKSRTQYGFKSEKLKFNLLETTTFKLALLFKSGVNVEQYIKGFNLLIPQMDNNRGFIPTTLELTDDPMILVLNIDTNWLKVPAYMGFYMLMLRLAYNYEGQDYKQFITTDFSSKTKINTNEFMSYNTHQDKMVYLYNGGELLQKWEALILS